VRREGVGLEIGGTVIKVHEYFSNLLENHHILMFTEFLTTIVLGITATGSIVMIFNAI
jgi:hypothetical protein